MHLLLEEIQFSVLLIYVAPGLKTVMHLNQNTESQVHVSNIELETSLKFALLLTIYKRCYLKLCIVIDNI